MALVDIYARHANGGFAWIPKPIDKKGPLLNYDATLEEVYELLTIYPQVWIYDSATKKVINLSNLSEYFPDYDPGDDSGGSGGGSGGVTPEQLATALQEKVDKVTGKGLSTEDYTTEEKTKLAGLSNYDDAQVYEAINSLGRSIGSMGQAVEGKVDKVSGKGLSTNDYTTEEKTKLSGIETGANKTIVDSALSSSSTNPVQNKVIKESLDSKVDKVSGKGLSTNDFTNADKTKLSGIEEGATKTIVDTDLSSTSTNPVQNKAVQVPIARLVDAGAKNLLKVTAISQTINGVTFTVNDDGTITVNGKNTGELTALFPIFETTLSPNIYSLSGCPVGGSLDGYYLGSLHTDNWVGFLTDTGTGASGQLNASKTIIFRIGVRPGTTVPNLSFKPMLCTAEDYAISHEFVPYTPTMREMYENKSDMSAVGLRLVASSILRSNTPYTYPMNMNDFDKNAIGTYIISMMTWSTTPKYSLYAVSYTGATFSYTSIVKIAGDDMTVTIEDGVISMSGLPSYGGKISIHALQ